MFDLQVLAFRADITRVFLAGPLGGAIKTGRHLAYPLDTPMSNLLLTMMDAVGVRLEKLGDSTGRLPLEPLALG